MTNLMIVWFQKVTTKETKAITAYYIYVVKVLNQNTIETNAITAICQRSKVILGPELQPS